MIMLSEMFSMIGQGDCQDVATSLGMQGTEPEISIPIYEIFYLKLLGGQKANFLAGSIQEFNAIRQLAQTCGAVAATINLLDMDILTLVGLVAVATPRTGMNVFIKPGEAITGELEEEILTALSSLAGVDLPPLTHRAFNFSEKLVNTLFNRFIEQMNDDLRTNLIEIHQWSDFAPYFFSLRNSGEMEEMYRFRQMMGGVIL